ncbi:hypothetical protein COCON_G00139250 [Conger conger]|uniref:C2H2-type domain-containing protein n=1 Tax=Conger conger TaxID=82655 RepID=A0A9Q1DAG4_CONCO|nr:hypothetical protein COCON_G00139250 [Conger conger]
MAVESSFRSETTIPPRTSRPPLWRCLRRPAAGWTPPGRGRAPSSSPPHQALELGQAQLTHTPRGWQIIPVPPSSTSSTPPAQPTQTQTQTQTQMQQYVVTTPALGGQQVLAALPGGVMPSVQYQVIPQFQTLDGSQVQLAQTDLAGTGQIQLLPSSGVGGGQQLIATATRGWVPGRWGEHPDPAGHPAAEPGPERRGSAAEPEPVPGQRSRVAEREHRPAACEQRHRVLRRRDGVLHQRPHQHRAGGRTAAGARPKPTIQPDGKVLIQPLPAAPALSQDSLQIQALQGSTPWSCAPWGPTGRSAGSPCSCRPPPGPLSPWPPCPCRACPSSPRPPPPCSCRACRPSTSTPCRECPSPSPTPQESRGRGVGRDAVDDSFMEEGGDTSPQQPIRRSRREACICPYCKDGEGRSDPSRKKQHICHIAGCGKVYGRREKKFSCTICPRRFMRSDHLSKHIKTHSNKKDTMATTAGPAPSPSPSVITTDTTAVATDTTDGPAPEQHGLITMETLSAEGIARLAGSGINVIHVADLQSVNGNGF